jgi:hypothetical protein
MWGTQSLGETICQKTGFEFTHLTKFISDMHGFFFNQFSGWLAPYRGNVAAQNV